MERGSLVTASIVKESPTASAGIRLGVNDDGLVCINHIRPLSSAAFTDLAEGMIIEAVNGFNCSTMKLKEVNTLFAGSKKVVTILARTTTDISVGRASFKSSRSLVSSRSILSGASSRESRESAESSLISSGSDPALDIPMMMSRAAPVSSRQDPALMDTVAPTTSKTAPATLQRLASPVPQLVAIESRDENSAWC